MANRFSTCENGQQLCVNKQLSVSSSFLLRDSIRFDSFRFDAKKRIVPSWSTSFSSVEEEDNRFVHM